MLSILATGVGAVAVVLLIAFLGQRRLIYLPDPSLPPPPADVEVVPFTAADGVEHRGWWVAAGTEPFATLVVCNGNAGNKADRLPLARGLAAEGVDTLLFDYRGYGDTPGSPSEAGLVADARAARAAAEERARAPVALFGESLGAAVATRIAADDPPAGLVLRSPFTSLADIARVHYPFLPAGPLLRDELAVTDLVDQVQAPVLVVLGTADRIVPPDQSRAVHDAAGDRAELVEIAGAGHNDPELGWGPELVSATSGFLRGATRIDGGETG